LKRASVRIGTVVHLRRRITAPPRSSRRSRRARATLGAVAARLRFRTAGACAAFICRGTGRARDAFRR